VSRFGAVVGPIFAGAMLSSGWSLHHFFGSMGVLVLIATTSLTILMLKADHGRAATVLRGTTA
jgi:hypothetical protein